MFRSFLSLFAGYVSILVIMFAGQMTLYLTVQAPEGPGQYTDADLLWNQVMTVVSAFMGGVMTAAVAHRKPFAHAAALSGIVFLIGIGNTTRLWHLLPHSYLFIILLGNAPMILIGGWVKSRLLAARRTAVA